MRAHYEHLEFVWRVRNVANTIADEKLTLALLDRLAENATVITTKGKSYRMRKRGAAASAEVAPAQPADSASAAHPEKVRKK